MWAAELRVWKNNPRSRNGGFRCRFFFPKAAGSPDVPVVKEEVKSTPSITKARALASKHLSIYGRTYARITWFGNLRLRWKRREVSCQSRRGLWESGVKHTIEVANGFICKVCTWGETPRESCPTTTTCGGCGATEIRWLSGWEEMDDFSSTLTIPYHNNKHQSGKIFWPFGCRFPPMQNAAKNGGFFPGEIGGGGWEAAPCRAQGTTSAEGWWSWWGRRLCVGFWSKIYLSAVPTGRWNIRILWHFCFFLDGFLRSKNTNIPKYINPKYYWFFLKKYPKI